ncbi:MAG: hypothetical protein QGG31_07670, partial [Anaerolineales bacterium]|nr:hypothetical protein [Anaerolineales bacterium]
ALSRGVALTLAGEMFSTGAAGWGQLWGRLDHFAAILTAQNHFWYLGSSPGNPLWLWAFGLAALAIVAQATRRAAHAQRGLALVLLPATGMLLVPLTPTPAGLFPHHLALFTPLWTTVVAVGTAAAAHLTRQHSAALIAIVLGLTALVSGDVTADMHMHRALAKGGGEGPHSAAIYALAERLQSLHPTHTVALDWGIAPQVRYLTAERINFPRQMPLRQTTDSGVAAHLADGVGIGSEHEHVAADT